VIPISKDESSIPKLLDSENGHVPLSELTGSSFMSHSFDTSKTSLNSDDDTISRMQ
jgi:hypothetical protein